jgi:hypothetical protein
MKIYIAGPMRGIKYFNFPEFDKARDKLIAMGHDVISPADMDRALDNFDPLTWPAIKVANYDGIQWRSVPDLDIEKLMERDLEAVAKCDAVFMLNGWGGSAGAEQEHQKAHKLGKQVYYESADGYLWLLPLPSPSVPVEKEEEHVLDEAKRLVSGERNAAYGPPNQDFQRTADMWTGLLQFKLKDGERIRAQDVAWMMMLLKASRAQHSGKRDNYVDAAGYAYCGWRCENGEKKT